MISIKDPGFVGKVPHDSVPHWLSKIDIFAAFSRRESFGLSVVEASFSGLPCVVTAVGGLPEVFIGGKTGFVVVSENIDAMAEASMKLVRNSELRRSLGSEGRHFALEKYTWTRCVDRVLEE